MLKDNANQEGWRLVLNFIDEFNKGEKHEQEKRLDE
jgi:hypothetical protein